ncbi:MAG: hypothetical protein JNJ41_02370 [Bacteroidia bacterium]|nr:hypothetical protein [Bacteroidia bacterium]
MKTISLSIFIFLLCCSKLKSQNLYVVTERFNTYQSINIIPFDSLFITNPSGVTTKYALPHYMLNPGAHDSQFTTIVNAIYTLGYKIMPTSNWEGTLQYYSNTTTIPQYATRTLFLGQP